MKKRGFILMETIVVIVVITVTLVTIFSSYNKILSKLKTENKYDNSEYIYTTKYIKDYLKKTSSSIISPPNISNYVSEEITDYSENENISSLKTFYGIKKIYIVNIEESGKIDNRTKQKFDAYMIDYLNKLDINKNTNLIIVEYQKNAKDSSGKNLSYYGTSTALYETYIASLEW